MESGKSYERGILLFVYTVDLFGEGRHICTFENHCIQNSESGLGDDTTKTILNTKGTMNDVTSKLKKLHNFIDGNKPENDRSTYGNG